MQGFLGLGGTWEADVNLTLQLVMGVALLCGMALARARRFEAHKYCQASVVILNGSFKSDEMVAGGATSYTFRTPGTYPYHCSLHGDRGGGGMAGTIVVVGQ